MLLLKIIQLSFNCNCLIKAVLDCAVIYIVLITEHNGDVSPQTEPRDATAHCHCRCTRYTPIFSHYFSCLRRNVPSGLWCPGLCARMPRVFLHSQNVVRLIIREDCSCHARLSSGKHCLMIFLLDLHERVYNLNCMETFSPCSWNLFN
jgi:hypothetical protein